MAKAAKQLSAVVGKWHVPADWAAGGHWHRIHICRLLLPAAAQLFLSRHTLCHCPYFAHSHSWASRVAPAHSACEFVSFPSLIASPPLSQCPSRTPWASQLPPAHPACETVSGAQHTCSPPPFPAVPIYDSLGESAVDYIINHSRGSAPCTAAQRTSAITRM